MRTMIGTATRQRRTRRSAYAAMPGGGGLASRRLYAGRWNALAVQRAFFSARATRQVTTRRRFEPWLGGAAMLAGVASWGLFLSLLGG
jgi:hypothetical protein